MTSPLGIVRGSAEINEFFLETAITCFILNISKCALGAIDRYGPEDHGGMPEISRDLLVLSKLNFKAGTSLSALEFPNAASLWRSSDRPGVRWP